MDFSQIVGQVIAAIPAPWNAVLIFLCSVIAAASVLAAALPQAKDGTIWSYVRKVLDFFAANFANAKNVTTTK